MNLFDKVSQGIMDAMKTKDKLRLETLRGIKKEFIEAQKAKSADYVLTDDEAILIMQRMVKQRRDSADIYLKQDRSELATQELAEVEIIGMYLPKQLSQVDLDGKIREIIVQAGATSPADMGKVMGLATKALVGVAAGKDISNSVRKQLNS